MAKTEKPVPPRSAASASGSRKDGSTPAASASGSKKSQVSQRRVQWRSQVPSRASASASKSTKSRQRPSSSAAEALASLPQVFRWLCKFDTNGLANNALPNCTHSMHYFYVLVITRCEVGLVFDDYLLPGVKSASLVFDDFLLSGV